MILRVYEKEKSVLKNLRISKFNPEEQYVYLTYLIKNSENEKTKELLKVYKKLLGKVLDLLWNNTKIEKRAQKIRKEHIITKLK